jgi:hypothetical protein
MKEERMTDHESEAVRTLFQDADLEHVPTSRDLIGPAVAWGDRRRRRDRWTVASVTGVVAAVAVAGVVALRPDGGPEAVSSGRAGPTRSSAMPPESPALTGTIAQREQQLLDTLRPYLPAGDRITCQDLGGTHSGNCSALMVSSPTGTSFAQWASAIYDYQGPSADAKFCHDHKATAEIPLVSGPVAVPGGTVQATSTDCEAQVNAQPGSLTEPTALTFHEAAYEFIPDLGPAYSMELFELVREMPWKPGDQIPDSHAMWGFDQHGPVLSPQQFATLVTSPTFGQVLQQVGDLSLQAAQPDAGWPTSSSPSH